MTELSKTLVTKGEFARMKDRSKAAVSNWISEGRISRAALIGENSRAKIWVEKAEADLAANLDDGQQAAQEKPVTDAGPLVDSFTQRRREADAVRSEHEAKLAELKVRQQEGQWIKADEARAAWAKELSNFISETETFIVNRLMREFAEEHGLDWKQVGTKARHMFSEFRKREADQAKVENHDGHAGGPPAPDQTGDGASSDAAAARRSGDVG